VIVVAFLVTHPAVFCQNYVLFELWVAGIRFHFKTGSANANFKRRAPNSMSQPT
jgi:hypothetical protein